MAKHCAGLDTYRMVPEVRKKKKERKKKKILMMRVIRVNKSGLLGCFMFPFRSCILYLFYFSTAIVMTTHITINKFS